MGIQSPSVSNLMQNSNLRGQYLKVYRKIICERLHIKNLIVIHATQKKYSKLIIISQQKKVMNTRKMESGFI